MIFKFFDLLLIFFVSPFLRFSGHILVGAPPFPSKGLGLPSKLSMAAEFIRHFLAYLSKHGTQ